MLSARTELVAGLVFTVLIALALVMTSRIDLAFSSDLETFSGPRAYPGIILGVMLALNLAVVAQQLLRIRSGETGGVEPVLTGGMRLAAAVFAALVAFLLAFEPVGYILTMVPLLFVAALLNGARSPVAAAVVAVALSAVCLVIFRYGLNTVLPEGVLGIDMVF